MRKKKLVKEPPLQGTVIVSGGEVEFSKLRVARLEVFDGAVSFAPGFDSHVGDLVWHSGQATIASRNNIFRVKCGKKKKRAKARRNK